MTEHRKPTLYICSDASLSIHQKDSAWACCIQDDMGKTIIKTGGILKEEAINGAFWAERFGMANAIFLASQLVDLSQYHVVLYCDNLGAIMKDTIPNEDSPRYDTRMKRRVWYERYIESYLEQALSYNIEFVKGHTLKETWPPSHPGYPMNFWCDAEAKRIRNAHYAKSKREKESK